jgi:hypothetical protein
MVGPPTKMTPVLVRKAAFEALKPRWYTEPNAIGNAIGYAKFFSRSHDVVIRAYDAAGALRGLTASLTYVLLSLDCCYFFNILTSRVGKYGRFYAHKRCSP